MTYNQYMHPRNIYRQPPDFKQLAIEFEQFRRISKMDINGTIHIDFKHEPSLRALTKCLLMKDFQLDVDLPLEKLVPALPLRLNYILWLEDVMAAIGVKLASGIDIGCGASCIYPLLAARKNAWRMYAVDIDDDSIKCARDNVRRNQLDDRITVIAANRDSDPFAVLLNDKRWSSIVADFTMCNPPFFEEPNLLDDGNDGAAKWTAERRGNRTGKRAQPSAASTGCEHELATGGGEIAFVTKMIRDGTELGNRVTVFTTMLGHKRSLLAIEAALKAHGIANYCTTAFCQGRTMRWAVAWTMRSDVQLRKVPSLGPVKAVARKKPLSFDVTECGSIADAHRRLCAILAALDGVILTEETVDADTVACRVVAHRNSWSRQRQKRRAERKCMDDASDGGQPPQMLCGEGTAGDADAAAASQVILEVLLAIRRVFCSRLELQLDYLAGQAGPNGAYQLLQFLINKWKDG